MQTALILFHVTVCIALILIVLLQTGRGAEMGAAFGGSSQTLFGTPSGTTFMDKVTTLTAIVFMVTCLVLTYFSGKPNTKSIMENVQVPAQPALPAAKPVQTQPAAKAKAQSKAATTATQQQPNATQAQSQKAPVPTTKETPAKAIPSGNAPGAKPAPQ